MTGCRFTCGSARRTTGWRSTTTATWSRRASTWPWSADAPVAHQDHRGPRALRLRSPPSGLERAGRAARTPLPLSFLGVESDLVGSLRAGAEAQDPALQASSAIAGDRAVL